VVATGIDNLAPVRQMQPTESSLAELAGRLGNDSRRIADCTERKTPVPPPLESSPLPPTTAQPAKPISEYARHAAPQASIRTAAPLLCAIGSRKTFSISRPFYAARRIKTS